MSTNTTVNNVQQEEFPVGFAEHMDTNYPIGDDTVFYVEWLDNSSEFPSLFGVSNDSDLSDGKWEVLQRKEINDEEPTLISVEDDAWSKVSTQGQLYAYVLEKNASELQPTKRTVQPLWSSISSSSNNKKEAKIVTVEEDANTIDEDAYYQDNLSYDLIYNSKSESRRANTKKRQLHDLKTVDFHVEGVLRLATTKTGLTNVTWVPYEKNAKTLDEHSKKDVVDTYVHTVSNFRKLSNKAQALTYTAKFTHNVKTYTYNYCTQVAGPKRPVFPDSGEFSVHSAIVRE